MMQQEWLKISWKNPSLHTGSIGKTNPEDGIFSIFGHAKNTVFGVYFSNISGVQ